MSKIKHKRKAEKLDLGDVFRKNAYVIKNGKKEFLKVSPSAIQEYKSRVVDETKINAREIAENVYNSKRKLITVKYTDDEDGVSVPIYDDITRHFGHVESKIASGTPDYCSRCLKKMEREK